MKPVFNLIVATTLSGCATHWVRPANATHAAFKSDISECRQYAAARTPMQRTETDTYTARTVVSGNTATTTVGPDPYAQLGNIIGDAIVNGTNEDRAIKQCMKSKGYKTK